jgi:hypothetical protein
MNRLTVITATFVIVFGTVASRAANLDRISAATGVPIETLQAQRASTGLGWGGLEKAHLLANASGRSFDEIVALHRSGQGWGKIARDNGLNLGKLVSSARQSSKATRTGQKVHGKKTHDKSTAKMGKGHSKMRGSGGHRSSIKSGVGKSAMRGMGRGGRGR